MVRMPHFLIDLGIGLFQVGQGLDFRFWTISPLGPTRSKSSHKFRRLLLVIPEGHTPARQSRLRPCTVPKRPNSNWARQHALDGHHKG